MYFSIFASCEPFKANRTLCSLRVEIYICVLLTLKTWPLSYAQAQHRFIMHNNINDRGGQIKSYSNKIDTILRNDNDSNNK